MLNWMNNLFFQLVNAIRHFNVERFLNFEMVNLTFQLGGANDIRPFDVELCFN